MFLTLCPPSIQKALLARQTARQHVDAVATALETMLARWTESGQAVALPQPLPATALAVGRRRPRLERPPPVPYLAVGQLASSSR